MPRNNAVYETAFRDHDEWDEIDDEVETARDHVVLLSDLAILARRGETGSRRCTRAIPHSGIMGRMNRACWAT